MIEIKKVETGNDIKKFIKFQYSLYEGDGNFVPEPYLMLKDIFNRKKNPFFSHSEADLFLAFKDGKVAGRIAAINNKNHISKYNDGAGFFGFLEVIEDYEVFQRLIDTAIGWLRSRNLNSMCGPTNFSTNDSCGILIEGFEYPPVVLMPYSKPYYKDYLEKSGFEKKIDMSAYNFPAMTLPQKLLDAAGLVEKNLNEKGITIRTIDYSRLEKDIMMIRDVYNKANEANWGFVPLTEKEFTHMAAEIKIVTNNDPQYIWVAESGGRIVGYMLNLPDINKAFKKLKNGRLFPFGIFKLLYHKARPEGMRIIILGIYKEFRNMGIDICMYAHTYEFIQSRKFKQVEAGYILENNIVMNKILVDRVGARVQKRYRIYSRNL